MSNPIEDYGDEDDDDFDEDDSFDACPEGGQHESDGEGVCLGCGRKIG